MKFEMKTILRIMTAVFTIVIVTFIISHILKVSDLNSKIEALENEKENYKEQLTDYQYDLTMKDSLYEELSDHCEELEQEIQGLRKEKAITGIAPQNYETIIEKEIVEENTEQVEEVIPESVEEYNPIVPAEIYSYGYIEGDTGFRSYEPYTAIGYGSIQAYILQFATPDENGLMSINGKPLVAIGTGWGYWLYDEITVYTDEGSYECIVGDIKADIHTNWTNKVTAANGCVVEFIVDPWSMDPAVKGTGSISSIPKYHGYVINIEKTGELHLN